VPRPPPSASPRNRRQYGFWRPYVQQVIYRYLDCGDIHNGFARVKCKDCGHEYRLAFSCKRRHFCPSCHQKRVVEFGEWVCGEVLKRFPIVILSSTSPNPSTLFPLRSFTPFGTKSLCLGSLEGVFPGDGLTKGCGPWGVYGHPTEMFTTCFQVVNCNLP